MRVLPLSARSPEALTALAGEYAAWLDQLEASTSSAREVDRILADAAWTAGTGRSHFKYRAGLTFRNVAELREGLDRLTASGVSPGQEGLRHTARTAFVYMGHGQHWTDTAEVLYWTEPVVRAALDRCDGLVREECGKSLLNAIFAKDGAGDGIEDPPMARAAHFSMQAALTTLWQSVGVLPSAVLGKGIGELAAAYGHWRACGCVWGRHLERCGRPQGGTGAKRPRCLIAAHHCQSAPGDDVQQFDRSRCPVFRRVVQCALAEACG